MELGNYNAPAAITDGLYSLPILRLQDTLWKHVSAHHLEQLQHMRARLASTHASATPGPRLPFLGTILEQLHELRGSQPDTCYGPTKRKLIAFDKARAVAEVVLRVRLLQDDAAAAFAFPRIGELVSYLHSVGYVKC